MVSREFTERNTKHEDREHRRNKYVVHRCKAHTPLVKTLCVDLFHHKAGLTVEKLLDRVENLQQSSPEHGQVRLAKSGYAYDDGSGVNVDDHIFILRLVLHHQTPREACATLIQILKKSLLC